MSYFPENALIIQSDRSVLLETHLPHANAAREVREIIDKLRGYHILIIGEYLNQLKGLADLTE